MFDVFVPWNLLDTCICRRPNPRHLARHLLTPSFVELYWGSIYTSSCDPNLISLDLSLDTSIFSPPKPLLLTPNLFPKGFSSFSRVSSLDSFSTPGGSIEPHLLCLMFLYLDTCSTHVSVDGQILDTWLDTFLNTSQHLHLSSFTEVLYIIPCAIRTSFLSISLSIPLSFHLLNLSHSLLISFPRDSQAFQEFLHLVSF